MSNKTATLAKSLHTVSVLVSVAQFVLDTTQDGDRDYAVATAVDMLGYGGAADPHGLAAKAVAILAKDAQ